jgi:hypothetical protein
MSRLFTTDQTTTARRAALLALAAAAAITSGCNNTGPAGDRGGTFDPNERTRIDRNAREADSVTLLEFVDQASQELSQRIATAPDIRNSPVKVVIEVGGIQNRTATPSSDFQAIQRRMFTNLVNSDIARDKADFVENLDRMRSEAARVAAPGTVDPLGRGGGTPPQGPATYDLTNTYFLQGTFSEISRGGGRQSTYLFDVTLTNAATRRIVFSSQITSKQDR